MGIIATGIESTTRTHARMGRAHQLGHKIVDGSVGRVPSRAGQRGVLNQSASAITEVAAERRPTR
jgi:hypothetical protein